MQKFPCLPDDFAFRSAQWDTETHQRLKQFAHTKGKKRNISKLTSKKPLFGGKKMRQKKEQQNHKQHGGSRGKIEQRGHKIKGIQKPKKKNTKQKIREQLEYSQIKIIIFAQKQQRKKAHFITF